MNIAITWPKSKALIDYLKVLRWAELNGQLINYRVSKEPRKIAGPQPRCYVVYDGLVRGYNHIIEVAKKGRDEVYDWQTQDYWPPGWYIVRDPKWHPVDPIQMKSFRGFRYVEF